MNENLRGFLSRLEAELNRLHREIASQRDRIEELASEVDRLQGEVLRREDLLDEMRRSRAWRLASRLQDLAVYLRRGLGRLRGDAAR